LEPETGKLELYLTTASPVVTQGNVSHGYKAVRLVYGSKYRNLSIYLGEYENYGRITITCRTLSVVFLVRALAILLEAVHG
jgi:hypothetical protein